jgi:hypothetical protein
MKRHLRRRATSRKDSSLRSSRASYLFCQGGLSKKDFRDVLSGALVTVTLAVRARERVSKQTTASGRSSHPRARQARAGMPTKPSALCSGPCTTWASRERRKSRRSADRLTLRLSAAINSPHGIPVFTGCPFPRHAKACAGWHRRRAGECPEWQRGRTVNPLAYAFVGSSPTSPTNLKS